MKGLLILCCSLLVTCLAAQNDPFSSHYMYNPTAYNPAWVGHEPIANVSFQFRSQWTGYSSSFGDGGGAPFTQFLTGVVPIRGALSGLGLSIINDNLGPVSNFMMNIPVSYSIATRRGKFILALAPGIFSQTQKWSELRPGTPGDPLIPAGGDETQTNVNLGAGLIYSFGQMSYLGIGATNLLEPGFDYGLDSLENVMQRSLTAIGGFQRIIGQNLTLAPSLLVRSDLNTFTFDISTQLLYKDRGWAGLSYRWDEALIFMVGYSFLAQNQLKIGYAMDYVVAKKDAKQATSQELFVRYNLPDLVLGGKKRVKTPRFSH